MRTSRRTTAATLLAAGLLLTGCGGTGGGGSQAGTASKGTSGGGVGAPAERGALDSGADEASAGDTAAGGSAGSGGKAGAATSARVAPGERAVVYRAELSVRVKDVAAAAVRAEGRARGTGGLVASEDQVSDPDTGRATAASLQLRVPAKDFRAALHDLAALGDQLSLSQSAEDVTSQLVDTESRIATQKRSVARVRALLDKAGSVGEIAQVEAELARREADLESLQAQQAQLSDLADLATINLSLVGPDEPGPDEDEDLGFLAGLRDGWDAFVAALLVGLTVLGAVLPFLLALALVAVPGLLVWRSRRRSGAVPPTPATAPPAG